MIEWIGIAAAIAAGQRVSVSMRSDFIDIPLVDQTSGLSDLSR